MPANAGDGFVAVGLVRNPAIERDFQCFSKVENNGREMFSVALDVNLFKSNKESDKRILVGALMVPDELIYRVHNGQGVNLVFTKDYIQAVFNQFVAAAEKDPAVRRRLNFEHSDMKVEGEITGEWIARPKDFSEALGIDSKPGAWNISVYVEDENIYNNFVGDVVKGFSIELMMEMEPVIEVEINAPAQIETKPQAAFAAQDFEAVRSLVLTFAQTPQADTINRKPDDVSALSALMVAHKCPAALLPICNKFKRKEPLTWNELIDTAQFFSSCKDFETVEARARGGETGALFVERTLRSTYSAIRQIQDFGMMDKMREFLENEEYRRFMRKFYGKLSKLKSMPRVKAEYEKLKGEGGKEYYLNNRERLTDYFIKNGVI